MEMVTYIILENQAFSTLNLQQCHFSPLLMFKFRGIHRCLAFPVQIDQ